MSTSDSHHNGAGISSVAAVGVGAAQPLLLRVRPGKAPESARVVHLAPLPPTGTGVLSAACGALLFPEDHEIVTPGVGMPCSRCVLSHAQHPDLTPSVNAEDTDTAPDSTPVWDPTSASTTPRAAVLGYRAWGWPVTLRGEQVWLTLGSDVMAILVPTLLAVETIVVLTRQGRRPAALGHPEVPEHLLLLGGERFGVALPWPPDVDLMDGCVPLPPTNTPGGPLTWVHPPTPNVLRACREIDIVAAVQAVLHDPATHLTT